MVLLGAPENSDRFGRAKLLSEVEARLFKTETSPIRLGRYTLADKIGRGGFGVVYRAVDPVLSRPVAIKLLRSNRKLGGLGSPEALIREARMAARLQHPNVVRVFDVGRVDEPAPGTDADVFVVMELLHGVSMKRWLKDAAPSLPEVVEMFIQVCEGLAAAHQRGIVHCDVKPANVFVTLGGIAKVLDFGLALHTSAADWTSRTMNPSQSVGSQVVAGTPPYMAPEAHEGLEVGPAADQYSLAIALTEALCGRPPFAAKDMATLVERKREGLSHRWLGQHGVSGPLREALIRATQPFPALRFPGMHSLAEALRESIRPPGVRPYVAPGGLALVGLTSAAVLFRAPAPCDVSTTAARDLWASARPAVEARWSSAPSGDHFVTRIDGYVDEWSSSAEQVCDPGGSLPVPRERARDCLNERLGRLDAVLGASTRGGDAVVTRTDRLSAEFVSPARCLDPAHQGEFPPTPQSAPMQLEVAGIRDLLSDARARHAAGDFEAGLALAKAGLQRAEALGFEPAAAEAMYEVGLLQVSSGDVLSGAEYIEQAYLSAEGYRHDRLAASASVRLVSVHGRHLGRDDLAREWVRRAELALQRLADNARYRAALEYNVGMLEYEREALDAAQTHFERALALYNQLGEHGDASTCRISLAVVANRQGRSEEARALFQEVYAQTRASLGVDHPKTARALSSLASAQQSLGHLALAGENFAQSLAILRKTLGDQHDSVAATLINLGVVEFLRGAYDEALEHHEAALAIHRALMAEEHPLLATTLDNIGSIHLRLEHFEDAQRYHAEALELRGARLEETHPRLAGNHANLALALAYLGRAEEATTAFATAESALYDQPQQLAAAQLQRAEAQRILGSPAPDLLRGVITVLEANPNNPLVPEAKFELALALQDEQPSNAKTAAQEAYELYRSMGADPRATTVKRWLDETPDPAPQQESGRDPDGSPQRKR
jgi:serine/threonine protein kinase/tetratricopeptide (TPR) repeat protein